MVDFAVTRDAKEFLVACIVGEAEREGMSLSPVERDMLFFTETAWTPLEDYAATNAAFEAECDSQEYELKIETLIRNFYAWARSENPLSLTKWKLAVRKIEGEDHYLQIMIQNAGKSPASRSDLVKLLLAALVVGILLTAVLAISASR